MKVLGLTGSIGMGKSTVAKMFAEEGVPVFDSDAAVHALYAQGGAAVSPVAAAFPGVTRDGAIDRSLLAPLVVNDVEAMRKLERIVHPLVREEQRAFLAHHSANGSPFVLLDIPLLLEQSNAHGVDVVIVVSAPPEVQRERVLARPGMTEEKFAAILARQMPDFDKRARADFVISTGCTLAETRAQVRTVLDALSEPH